MGKQERGDEEVREKGRERGKRKGNEKKNGEMGQNKNEWVRRKERRAKREE